MCVCVCVCVFVLVCVPANATATAKIRATRRGNSLLICSDWGQFGVLRREPRHQSIGNLAIAGEFCLVSLSFSNLKLKAAKGPQICGWSWCSHLGWSRKNCANITLMRRLLNLGPASSTSTSTYYNYCYSCCVCYCHSYHYHSYDLD